ncbi:MAG: metallophosphoesterase [Hyphomicrobiaceae bacterium]|nr:metallophosphoesterase [Hyphomicrobiaceae bacterium]
MIIAQISDTHIALDEPDTDQRLKDFRSVIADINALDPAPDVIVHTGDVVHNGRADEYAAAADILKAANAPAYVMVGNKDDRANLRAAFADVGYLDEGSEFIDYAVEDFPVRLIMLDTLSPGHNRGDFCADRVKRFEDMIEADTSKPIAVFTHHPPYEVSVGPDPIHFHDLDAMEALRGALQHGGHVIRLFSGHVHRATFGAVGDIPATVMSAVSTNLRKGDYPDHMTGRPVYQLNRHAPGDGFVTETRIACTR